MRDDLCAPPIGVYFSDYPIRILKPLESQILRTKEIWNNIDIGLCGPFGDSL